MLKSGRKLSAVTSIRVGSGPFWFIWTLSHQHDDVIKWKHFPRYTPFVQGIHQSQVNSPHKGQWRGALKFSLICVWINGWVNNGEAGDLRRHRAPCDVILMKPFVFFEIGRLLGSSWYKYISFRMSSLFFVKTNTLPHLAYKDFVCHERDFIQSLMKCGNVNQSMWVFLVCLT